MGGMTTIDRENLHLTTLRAASGPPRRTRSEARQRNFTLAAFDEAAGSDMSVILFWNQNAVLVNRDDLIHEVLVTRADSFRKGPLLTRNARPILGNGLLTSDNELNRQQRRIISPAFAHKKIRDYAGIVACETEAATSKWASGEKHELTSLLLNVTFQITDRLLFGEQRDQESDSAILRALPILMNFAVDELRSPLRATLRLPHALAALILLRRSLNRRISMRKRRGQPDSSEDADLLDTLLFGNATASGAMPARLVRDEAMTMFLAGLETVAMAIAWCLYSLVSNPQYLDVAHAEADAIGHIPSYNDLAYAPFVLAALKESMRVYPPVYLLARQAMSDVPIGGQLLRRGTVVFVSPYLRHRRAEAFVNPQNFDPRRWMTDNFERGLPRYSFMPFGGGQHVCVGGHFALMQGHLILVTLLQQFRFTLVPGQIIEPEPLFTLRPRGGIIMRINRR